MIEQVTTVDKIEFMPEIDRIFIRQKRAFIENGEELSYTYHRHSIGRDDDRTQESEEVRKVADAVWSAL